MVNYVWRLEFQKNGNVHYHLVTDTYLDYFLVRKIWNRILEKGGYISDFAEKFNKLSLNQYKKLVDPSGTTNFNVIAKRYANGCKNKWREPNTVDVKSVVNGKKIAFYISKYFSKSADGNPLKNELDNSENTANMRLWYASKMLSKVNSLVGFVENVDFCVFELGQRLKGSRYVVFKYCKQFYFDLFLTVGKARSFIEKLLKNYAFSLGYQPSS